MSFGSDVSPFEPYSADWRQDGGPWLAEQFSNVSQFLRGLRMKMRYGELTRAPLRLLRFNILGHIAKCDWVARAYDPWDADLSPNVQQRHASLQALKDAINVRSLLFESMPYVETADFRIYRETSDYQRGLIITGCVQKNDHSARNLHSLAMRAKILGFRFQIEGDILQAMPPEDQDHIR